MSERKPGVSIHSVQGPYDRIPKPDLTWRCPQGHTTTTPVILGPMIPACPVCGRFVSVVPDV